FTGASQQPFFVKSRGYNVRFNINGIVFTTTWSNPGVFRGMKSFILTLVPPKNMSISHMPQYIFNPEFGFIAIRNEVTLIRKDIQFLEE
ncbi:hypothetical protein, partial [[Flexibacter] sp. ATCC 35208]|uniref:hypothetical protein n=1 Tax=[Flexibacter] sp. ATCC 35208 TaxID=1936242 RepID=UPI0009D23BE9